MADKTQPTRFWLIRHAMVEPASLAILYGQLDVALCSDRMIVDRSRYVALAERLPRKATWFVTPLARTRATAEAIMAAGYPSSTLTSEPALIEQDFGAWQGMAMQHFADRPAQHPFWPVGGDEQPPDGENFGHVRARVGTALDRLGASLRGQSVIIVSHGGAIRAAVAHALDLSAHQALSLAIDNLSITRLDRHADAWRVVSVNEQISI